VEPTFGPCLQNPPRLWFYRLTDCPPCQGSSSGLVLTESTQMINQLRAAAISQDRRIRFMGSAVTISELLVLIEAKPRGRPLGSDFEEPRGGPESSLASSRKSKPTFGLKCCSMLRRPALWSGHFAFARERRTWASA
jgi:hypothetical protein